MNLLHSGNPFGLADPPTWFLRALADFDRDLVLFASLKAPVFRLARRCRHSPGVAPANVPGVSDHPDTIFMWQHKVVPVSTLIPRAHWTTDIFRALRARDIWAHGGALKVITLLEDQEARHQARVQADFASEGDARGKDAYRSYKYRTGQRISLAAP